MFEWFDGGQMISALPHVICAIIGWELGRRLGPMFGYALPKLVKRLLAISG